MKKLVDIKPVTPVRSLDRESFENCDGSFPLALVCDVVGMSSSFVRRVLGKPGDVSPRQLLCLLDQDAFFETFVPRSRVLEYLLEQRQNLPKRRELVVNQPLLMMEGSAHELIDQLPPESVNCVVTSPPYWATRIYDKMFSVDWADGEACAYGHEQTPEGYIRHTIELMVKLRRTLTIDGSIWWNVMDTYNTRTQVRSNAAEALRAMQGKDEKGWNDHDVRRYSAGHVYLKDGEQCGIPGRIVERMSRIGLYAKATITWSKSGTLPEPQNSRVSRALEYIIHATKQRTPKFDKEAFRQTAPQLGGRNSFESDRLTDVWTLSTSSGRDGHGAQFALALPGRCIALSTSPGDTVLDPFSGGGTSGIAATRLGRRFVGFDVSAKYLATARQRIASAQRATEHQISLAL